MSISTDVEQESHDAYLYNSAVQSLSWRNVTVSVKDKSSKKLLTILDNAAGDVQAGEICALMGPSGCGKTTLLNVLAHRPTTASSVESNILVNDSRMSRSKMGRLSSFVEQEDVLIGSLTVQETLDFSSSLASASLTRQERRRRVDALLTSFGLIERADTLVGTPLRKGISGGQKSRVSVASQLITSPKILFLDEPTTGLDSSASWELVNYLKSVARRNRLIIVFSIHQPSTITFRLFDKLMLLSQGQTFYFGRSDRALPYFESLGVSAPGPVNPAEFLVELVNIDYAQDKAEAEARLGELRRAWTQARETETPLDAESITAPSSIAKLEVEVEDGKPGMLRLSRILLHRSLIKSYRDPMAYAVRVAMYIGLGILVGTIWLRLEPTQASIPPLTKAIFFGSSFVSIMAVAYVPAYLEDRFMYSKEHRNGLYGATELIVSNFFIGLPYLLFISIVTSAILYWLCNLRPTALAFVTWVMWLYLDLLAAESAVVLTASLFPSFVFTLAIVAFANGIWMSVSHFMVPPGNLNAFYKYAFYYWDYLEYVFRGMMVNEFKGRSFACAAHQQCASGSSLTGQAVLDEYGFGESDLRKDVSIVVAIIVGFRLLAWAVLKASK
ncbi:hypothetical protein HIM_04246 [Hirsutella minnesotensis 3608]|uniref:ABC transporter domain-containing protein n=1 Tax=Hirsutella minnesotensis 3608 TaxID=1043627 RepID=A0A0F8A1U4_9HYPO|nr:hypothetical protein HIM_04246 [Hirsutella minnesotensis 3608]